MEELQALAPAVDRQLIEEHLGRLDAGYFATFSAADVADHLQALARLNDEHPIEVLQAGHTLTVLGFDHPSTFSLICGVLASTGWGIRAGRVFTYAPAAGGSPRRPRRDALGRILLDPLRRRRIIDRFEVSPAGDAVALRMRLETVARLLDRHEVSAARRRVNEWVTERLRDGTPEQRSAMYPVEVEAVNVGGFTRLTVRSQDTPAFLYAFSTGLALHGVSVERVRITTSGDSVEDELDVVDAAGRPIDDPAELDLLRVSAALTKHFTYFLDGAPDPSAALERFKLLVQDVVEHRGEGVLNRLSAPGAMQGLARVLGASDFLWEDFVRRQYETLLAFFQAGADGRALSRWLDEQPARMAEAMTPPLTLEERRSRLNALKDEEAFLIDVEHVLSSDVAQLSRRLTNLAERVVAHAAAAVYAELATRHGQPGAGYAIFGLGKLGGESLGYASDLELLVVYGSRAGAGNIDNGSFYSQLVQGLTRFIEAKQDGLFEIDLKLRPFGIDGPLATTLDGFAAYYGPGGPAHSLERLSLTRLRGIAGEPELRQEVERLRDEVLYDHPSLKLDELRTTRTLQFEQKNRPGQLNAKYSSGALVDVEYATEILQVQYGKSNVELRTPRTEQALAALAAAGIISAGDLQHLLGAYGFLGRLINGLRMLRGWSGDLFMPAVDSGEYRHLARRLGYQARAGLSAEQQLDVEWQTRTAAVREFVERRFGPAGLPGPNSANVADLVLAGRTDPEVRRRVLLAAGFRDPDRSYQNLRRLAAEDSRRDAFAELVVLACAVMARHPDPDGLLEGWRRQVDGLPDAEAHFRELLADPSRLGDLFSRGSVVASS